MWGVPNSGGVLNTWLITCRSSKEHRDLNSVGECKGSKYVCTCSHLESSMFLLLFYFFPPNCMRQLTIVSLFICMSNCVIMCNQASLP